MTRTVVATYITNQEAWKAQPAMQASATTDTIIRAIMAMVVAVQAMVVRDSTFHVTGRGVVSQVKVHLPT